MKRGLKLAATATSMAALLSGCGSLDLSGVGASDTFECSAAAQDNIPCMSLSGVNINASHGTLPGMRSKPEDKLMIDDKKSEEATTGGQGQHVAAYGQTSGAGGMVSPAAMNAPYSGAPIRSAPKYLRVWMAPLEDTDSDLHDQRYLYVTVHTGKWLIEANQSNVVRTYKPVIKLGSTAKAAAEEDDQKKSGGTGTQRFAGSSVGQPGAGSSVDSDGDE